MLPDDHALDDMKDTVHEEAVAEGRMEVVCLQKIKL